MSNLIPDHLLIKILRKLPVKALLKCRCVCKSWNSLITSPLFINTHFTTAQKSHLLIKCYSRIRPACWYSLFQPHKIIQPAHTLEFPFTSRLNQVPFEVVGSVGGLICLVDGSDSNLIIVWNPMIGKHIKLPMPTIASAVAFVGLGFDHLTNDFKVVRFAYTGFKVDWKYRGKVELWSLQQPVWRVLDHEDMECLHMAKPCSSAFVINGSIHWFVSEYLAKRDEYEHNVSMNAVLSFDVEKETFQTIGLPEELKYTRQNTIGLSKFGSSLALMYFDYRFHPCRCVMWVMTEYGVEESWTTMISTDLQLGVENKSWVREHWTNMLIAANESELSMVSSCDADHDYGRIFGLQYEKGEFVAFVDTFMESLVLLDHKIGALPCQESPIEQGGI